MWAKRVVWGLALASLIWVVFITALDLWLLSRLPHLPQARALDTAVALVCLIPFTLAGWAVPLGVGFRLIYDRRVPAWLPTWRRDGQVGLVVDYRSAFWRGYAALFGCSLVLIPLHLLGAGWGMLALHLMVLSGVAVSVAARQWRRNTQDHVIIQQQPGTVHIPPLGEVAWADLDCAVEAELVVSPRSDTHYFWVTIAGRRWKRFALREQAEAVASWLTGKTCEELGATSAGSEA